jgi:hypothetical protein
MLKLYQDPEFKAKHAAAQKARFSRPEELAAHAERRADSWKVISPEGVEQVIKNLRGFCVDNHLSQTRMSCMGRGETIQGSYKNWQCFKLSPKRTRQVKVHNDSS